MSRLTSLVKAYCNQGCKQDFEIRDRDETETFDFQSETRARHWVNASLDRDIRA